MRIAYGTSLAEPGLALIVDELFSVHKSTRSRMMILAELSEPRPNAETRRARLLALANFLKRPNPDRLDFAHWNYTALHNRARPPLRCTLPLVVYCSLHPPSMMYSRGRDTARHRLEARLLSLGFLQLFIENVKPRSMTLILGCRCAEFWVSCILN